MTIASLTVLDQPHGVDVDPDEMLRAAMQWHFGEDTGSPFWLRRASSLGFDPRTDVRTHDDLDLFPNVTDELRDVPTRDLIPQGYGPRPPVVSVIESGGTTGRPKRVPLLKDFADRLVAKELIGLKRRGVNPEANWMSLFPSGPHGAFDQARRAAAQYGRGALVFGVDMDPRWIKRQIGAGHGAVAEAYVEHVLDQAGWILESEDVEVLRAPGPLLVKLAQRESLAELVRQKITHIGWGGAHLDPESRYFLRTEVFPDIAIRGAYGTTMALGAGGSERAGLGPEADCVFDPDLSPYVTLKVVDPVSGQRVGVGQRGQVVVNHVSKSFLLPNNRERDEGTRVEPVSDRQVGDSVAEISPLAEFGGTPVVVGVY